MFKNNKTIELVLGSTEGNLVYARRNDLPSVYKVDKKVLDDLNFKVEEIIEK